MSVVEFLYSHLYFPFLWPMASDTASKGSKSQKKKKKKKTNQKPEKSQYVYYKFIDMGGVA